MKHLLHIGIALILLTLATSSSAVHGVAASTRASAMSRYPDNTSVRKPAVAGSFYPSSASEIRSMLGAWLHPTEGSHAPQAVIVPHAGYVFSGEVAASAFSRITAGHNYKRIFLLGPSRYKAS